ncbi:MAG: HAMP domain-containing protein [Betaproteobacteria bacterium]|nr:HAMP domain-containing protein [Betaproteobacteria bacterium]
MISSIPRAKSLEGRIVGFFVVLLLTVQIAGLFSIRYAIEQNARNNLREELNVGVRVFKRLLEQNSQQLVEATAVLTYDYGFREAVAVQDRDTILSVLNNHSARIKASGMALVNLQNVVLADTMQPNAGGVQFAFPELISNAAEHRRSSAIRLIDGTIYQIVVVPVLAPLPIAWVAMSFVIDNVAANDLKRITGLDVTFIGSSGSANEQILATTVSTAMQLALKSELKDISRQPETRGTKNRAGDEFEVLSTTIERYDNTRVTALLQRSLREGLQPYDSLQVALLFLAAIGLIVSLIGSLRIARRITRPVRELAEAAGRVESGDYRGVASSETQSEDEIGALAKAFNSMSRGLSERDRMRDVLGKVASPEIAAQLLEQKIELGGEERAVTVLFADIRNFTSLCERLTPHQSLDLLNRYLACINGVIDRHDGIIDKYTGDGVMALFGAPITRIDDPRRAILAALEIIEKVDALGRELAKEGLPNPAVGIGINTSQVVAGNIGTPSRFNYTVLGDGVNLAARLENLTKRYQVPLVVGQQTRELATGLIYRELDKVRVRGKSVAVHIFQPLAREGDFSGEQIALLEQHHAAIHAFRNRNWILAKREFGKLRTVGEYERISELYLGYIQQFEIQSPDDDWDGAFTLYDK